MMWLRDYDLSNKKKWYRGEYSSSEMLSRHFRRFFLLIFIVSCVLNTFCFMIEFILRGVIKNE